MARRRFPKVLPRFWWQPDMHGSSWVIIDALAYLSYLIHARTPSEVFISPTHTTGSERASAVAARARFVSLSQIRAHI